VVTRLDGCVIPNYPVRYDRVLLDAPCMGLGVISKERGIKASKEEKDMEHCVNIQVRLLIAAIDAVDVSKAAIIVYSTCSISVEENEAIVNKALKRRYVKVVETGLPFGIEGITKYRGKEFHPSLKHARRYYPHAHNIDGFFVCKLQKLQNGIKTKQENAVASEEKPPLVLTKPVGNLKKGDLMYDEERPKIDEAKEEKKTQKNKSKKARKRERKLARMHGESGDEDDVDMTDLAPPKAAPKATPKPAAKTEKKPDGKTNGKANGKVNGKTAAPAKPSKPAADDDDDDDVFDDAGDDDEYSGDDAVSEEEEHKPANNKPKPAASKPTNSNKKGTQPNGTTKGTLPQRKLRGSKQ